VFLEELCFRGLMSIAWVELVHKAAGEMRVKRFESFGVKKINELVVT
jgi:hypothetical protein